MQKTKEFKDNIYSKLFAKMSVKMFCARLFLGANNCCKAADDIVQDWNIRWVLFGKHSFNLMGHNCGWQVHMLLSQILT